MKFLDQLYLIIKLVATRSHQKWMSTHLVPWHHVWHFQKQEQAPSFRKKTRDPLEDYFPETGSFGVFWVVWRRCWFECGTKQGLQTLLGIVNFLSTFISNLKIPLMRGLLMKQPRSQDFFPPWRIWTTAEKALASAGHFCHLIGYVDSCNLCK